MMTNPVEHSKGKMRNMRKTKHGGRTVKPGHWLIPRTTVPVPHSTYAEISECEQRILDIQALIDQLNSAYSHTQETIDLMMAEFTSEVPAETARRQALKEELDALILEKKAEEFRERVRHAEDDTTRKSSERKTERVSHQETSNAELQLACKRLFLKIATKTHPDKVDDSELHKIFLDVKRAYEALDLMTLQDLWSQVATGINLRLKRLMLRLQAVKNELTQTRTKVRQQQESVEAKMAVDWKLFKDFGYVYMPNMMKARTAFMSRLQIDIINLVIAINNFDPSRYMLEAEEFRRAVEEARKLQAQQQSRVFRISASTTTSNNIFFFRSV
jgi:hypothetical protein